MILEGSISSGQKIFFIPDFIVSALKENGMQFVELVKSLDNEDTKNDMLTKISKRDYEAFRLLDDNLHDLIMRRGEESIIKAKEVMNYYEDTENAQDSYEILVYDNYVFVCVKPGFTNLATKNSVAKEKFYVDLYRTFYKYLNDEINNSRLLARKALWLNSL